jgi:macrolide transport system ATP-binding/permease protein
MRLEHWLCTIPLRLRSLFRRGRVEQELDEELQFHLQQRIELEIAAGKTPEEARYTALRAMEGIEQQKEECRMYAG